MIFSIGNVIFWHCYFNQYKTEVPLSLVKLLVLVLPLAIHGMGFFGLKLGLFLFATFKYLFAALIAVGSDLSVLEGFILVTSGGIVGSIVFTFFSEAVWKGISKLKKSQKKNWKGMRRMVKLRQGFGLIGISLLSPIAISIPVGCFLSKTFESNNLKIVLYMSGGVVLWSLVFFGAKYFFGISFG